MVLTSSAPRAARPSRSRRRRRLPDRFCVHVAARHHCSPLNETVSVVGTIKPCLSMNNDPIWTKEREAAAAAAARERPCRVFYVANLNNIRYDVTQSDSIAA